MRAINDRTFCSRDSVPFPKAMGRLSPDVGKHLGGIADD